MLTRAVAAAPAWWRVWSGTAVAFAQLRVMARCSALHPIRAATSATTRTRRIPALGEKLGRSGA